MSKQETIYHAHNEMHFPVTDSMDYMYLGQSFFIFRFTDPPDPIFWKLKKKIKRFFFNFIFLFPSDSCQYSTGVQLCLFYCSQVD